MKWKVLRRDFVDGVVPCRLGTKRHNITSGVAYVIENECGEIAYSGPACAKNKDYVSNPQDVVPDFTSKLLSVDEMVGTSAQGERKGALSQAEKEFLNNKKAKFYLEFLFVYIPALKLSEEENTGDDYLNFIIKKIQNGDTKESIQKNDMYMLLDIIETTEGTKFDLNYMLFAYTYLKQIDFLLNIGSCSQSDTDFLQNCRNYVVKHRKVSQGQFNQVLKKLEKHNRKMKYCPL
ncbi:hypothetical protein M5252_004570 [Vibrio parahaemolyticus]|nr:hypothetical protein [Vibrio parahaemolyticus]EJE8775017.1 hypothetical protein [Vibrio parahaemolyticus]